MTLPITKRPKELCTQDEAGRDVHHVFFSEIAGGPAGKGAW